MEARYVFMMGARYVYAMIYGRRHNNMMYCVSSKMYSPMYCIPRPRSHKTNGSRSVTVELSAASTLTVGPFDPVDDVT